MSATTFVVDGRLIRVGQRIGRGGEGEVYTIAGSPTLALKVYTTQDLAIREAKIALMVEQELGRRVPLAAFPLAVARRQNGSFAGFVMRLVENHQPLFELYAPGARKNRFPTADYRFLVRASLNISRAFGAVHASGCVVGDVNHSGILISNQATATLIDADSFQIVHGTRKYLCRVGVPEYTPPELQGQRLSDVIRTPNHDAFGLAIILFQMLFMGRHPFVGTVRRGEVPLLSKAISEYRFVYAENRNVGMDQPPGTPVLSDFPQPISDCFHSAFSFDSRARRPTAVEWIDALKHLEAALSKCADNTLHFYPATASECPWCYMDRECGTVLFVPPLPLTAGPVTGFDPGAAGFDIGVIWRQIEAIVIPTAETLFPTVSSQMPSNPSREVTHAKLKAGTKRLVKGVVLVVAALGFIAVPGAWFIWLALGAVGWGVFEEPDVAAPIRARFRELEAKWVSAVDNWRRRIGIDECLRLKESLKEARALYEGLAHREKEQIGQYQSHRRERQLDAFLRGYQIRHAKIRGIGPAKEAALASYGIDTAADVKQQKVLRVPGFGPVTAKPLMEWRRRLEGKFAYNAQTNEVDRREVALIKARIASEGSKLRTQLTGGVRDLREAVRRTSVATRGGDTTLERLYRARAQAIRDLEHLGERPPIVQLATTSSPVPQKPSTRPTVSAPPGTSQPSSIPSCPRCSSRMVRRKARRGRWAGRDFWGCSRYPQCRGTRNI